MPFSQASSKRMPPQATPTLDHIGALPFVPKVTDSKTGLFSSGSHFDHLTFANAQDSTVARVFE
jgi:hypothetical protein